MLNCAIEKKIKGKRHYEVPSGGVYPSVTTVLSIIPNPKLQAWINAVGEPVANYARIQGAKRGEEFHSIVEDYLKCQPLDKYKRVLSKGLFQQAVPALMDISVIQIQEQVLWSDALKVAGRVDCIANYLGVPSVIDFKTATRPKVESDIQNYFQQATCYSLMYEERANIKVEQIVIIVSCESGDMQVIIKDRKDYIEALKSTLDQYHAQREILDDISV